MDDQMRALYTHKLNQEKAGKLGKGRKADRATVWQTNRTYQTRSRRQKNCIVNEIQHAKRISELG